MPKVINTNTLCMGCMSTLEDPNSPCTKCGFDLKNYDQNLHQLKPYTILSGKYLVGRVLGEGGFGITYLGWDLNLDIKIAIKEYYPTGLVTRETTSIGTCTVTPFSGEKKEFYNSGLDKFVNEAKSLAKFYTLPGIVAVKDFFRENGTAYIVMEYVDGITLKQHLANSGGKLGPIEVFELMRPIMKSLYQIHAEGIIHRDISPDNIMLTNKGDIKLLDFGAARDFITDGNKSLSVLLKPGYAPEEQYRTKGHQGPWTDVYALCATIYKMITGQTPPESLERFSEDELVPPSKLEIQLSQQTENALLKGLAVFQKDRYQSIVALYNDIYGVTQWGKAEPEYNEVLLEQEISRNKASATIDQAVKTISQGGNSQKEPNAEIAPVNLKRFTKRIVELIIPMAAHLISLMAAIICFGSGGISSGIIASIIINMTFIAAFFFRKEKNTVIKNTIHIIVQVMIVFYLTDLMHCYMHYYDYFAYFKAGEYFAYFSPFVIVLLNITYSLFKMISYNNTHKSVSDKEKKFNLTSVVVCCAVFALTSIISISSVCSFIKNAQIARNDLKELDKINSTNSETSGSKATTLYGNTPGNIINGSIAAQQDNWIYYRNSNDNDYIYKIRSDGSADSKINDDHSYSINVVGDWIYYSNGSEGNSIYKIRTDGSEKTKLNNIPSLSINVSGDWIYYQNGADCSDLYKIRRDGTDNIKLSSGKTDFINVVDDWIYYSNNNDNNSIYKISTDGTQETKINSYESWYINVVDDWIYYNNRSDENQNLYKMHLDGSENTRITNNKSYFINVVSDWIYYSNGSENGSLYKIRTDGTENTKLNDVNSWNINVAGDWIYYINHSESDCLYKIRTDGTGLQKVGAKDSSSIRSNAPKYTGSASPGQYSDDNISFSFPTEWALSTNDAGYPLITGIQGGVQYQLSVLDITSDTTSDIYDYTLSKLPVTPMEAGMGSVGNSTIGNYSGVLTGCLYQNGAMEGSVTLYCITEGKKRVAFATWIFMNDNSNYNDQVYQNIINTFIIK